MKKYDNITLVEGDVVSALPLIIANNKIEKVDFIFLDAAKATYIESFKAVDKIMKLGGIVTAHDTFMKILDSNDSIRFRKYLESRKDYVIINVDIYDRGLTIAQKVKE